MIIPVIITTGQLINETSNSLSFNDEKKILKKTSTLVYHSLNRKPLIVYQPNLLNIVSPLTYKDFLIFNPKPNANVESSIRIVTEWILHNYSNNVSGIMFFMGNQPFISKEIIKEERKTFRNNEKMNVVTTFEGQYGFPIIIGKNYFKYLLQIKNKLTDKAFIKKLDNVHEIEGNKDCIDMILTKEEFEKVKKSLN